MIVVVDLDIFGNSGGSLHDPDGFIIITDHNVLESGIPPREGVGEDLLMTKFHF